jgi:opacity protein-like surface antigen
MKRIFHYGLVSLLIIHAAACFANSSQVIYGVEPAKTVMSGSASTYYIQAGSFLDPVKADRYQAYLTTKTFYPVKQKQHGHFHVVTIGPLPSAAAVRKTARAISENMPSRALAMSVRTSHESVKSVSQTRSVSISTHSYWQPSAIMKDQIASSYWVFSLGAGIQFPQFAKNIRINNNSGFDSPYDQDVYSTHRNHQPVIALSVSRRFELPYQWLSSYSLGILYQCFPSADIGNTITQYSDPEFLNYNYTWDLSSNVLLASLKLNLLQWHRISPYLTGAIGNAFNRASNYIEMPVPNLDAPRVDPGFSSNTTSQFAYSAGAGFDIQLARTVTISAEYRFQDLGKFLSGKGNGTWSNRSLKLGSFRTNMVLINMNYQI